VAAQGKAEAQTGLWDISLRLSPKLVTYPGDPPVSIVRGKGDGALVHKLCLGSHSGTHIDAPAHMLSDGLPLDSIDLRRLIGPCCVVDCTDCAKSIDAQALASRPIHCIQRVLLKTRNSELLRQAEFSKDYVSLTVDGASFLAERGAWLVGIDYLSIGEFGAGGIEVHRELFAHGVLILEGLDLSQVDAGRYQLLCLPLRLDVPDAAPVRAVLLPFSGR